MNKFKDVKLSKYDSNSKRLPEHKTLLSFNNDGGNYAFNDWWYEIGSELFNNWCLKNEEYKCEASS
jgi:hypothetical protein